MADAPGCVLYKGPSGIVDLYPSMQVKMWSFVPSLGWLLTMGWASLAMTSEHLAGSSDEDYHYMPAKVHKVQCHDHSVYGLMKGHSLQRFAKGMPAQAPLIEPGGFRVECYGSKLLHVPRIPSSLPGWLGCFSFTLLGHANCPPPWHTFARFYTQKEQCKKLPFFERVFSRPMKLGVQNTLSTLLLHGD